METSLYYVLFELNCNLCDRFQGLTPFEVRKARFHEVILISRRLIERNEKDKKKKNKSGIIKRKAMNDNWY